jgi:hypothetical protein
MRLRHEFVQGYSYLHPAMVTIRDAMQEILDNEDFCEILSVVLVTGNFVNMGGYAGNAAGFKLDSLTKMDDTRANKPRMTLTHYVVQVFFKNESTQTDLLLIYIKFARLLKIITLMC